MNIDIKKIQALIETTPCLLYFRDYEEHGDIENLGGIWFEFKGNEAYKYVPTLKDTIDCLNGKTDWFIEAKNNGDNIYIENVIKLVNYIKKGDRTHTIKKETLGVNGTKEVTRELQIYISYLLYCSICNEGISTYSDFLRFEIEGDYPVCICRHCVNRISKTFKGK